MRKDPTLALTDPGKLFPTDIWGVIFSFLAVEEFMPVLETCTLFYKVALPLYLKAQKDYIELAYTNHPVACFLSVHLPNLFNPEKKNVFALLKTNGEAITSFYQWLHCLVNLSFFGNAKKTDSKNTAIGEKVRAMADRYNLGDLYFPNLLATLVQNTTVLISNAKDGLDAQEAVNGLMSIESMENWKKISIEHRSPQFYNLLSIHPADFNPLYQYYSRSGDSFENFEKQLFVHHMQVILHRYVIHAFHPKIQGIISISDVFCDLRKRLVNFYLLPLEYQTIIFTPDWVPHGLKSTAELKALLDACEYNYNPNDTVYDFWFSHAIGIIHEYAARNNDTVKSVLDQLQHHCFLLFFLNNITEQKVAFQYLDKMLSYDRLKSKIELESVDFWHNIIISHMLEKSLPFDPNSENTLEKTWNFFVITHSKNMEKELKKMAGNLNLSKNSIRTIDLNLYLLFIQHYSTEEDISKLDELLKKLTFLRDCYKILATTHKILPKLKDHPEILPDLITWFSNYETFFKNQFKPGKWGSTKQRYDEQCASKIADKNLSDIVKSAPSKLFSPYEEKKKKPTSKKRKTQPCGKKPGEEEFSDNDTQNETPRYHKKR